MKLLLIVGAIVIGWSGFAQAQSLKLSAEDTRAIESCIKEKESKEGADRCIGLIANPCLDTSAGQSTAGQAGCYQREQLVWDDILNETYRRLQGQFEGKLKTQLRDLQRVWIEARKQQCEFYRDVIQGSLAIPIGASCMNTETARRAIYLLSILNI
ncbi:MAG: lysozyme inhibitor LprI family protein [Xanthobacteraceae bacterium]